MKISIVTATYNRADTIRDTIESILSQTYQDWEHIIIDGASKDNTLDVIKEYEDRYNGRLKLVSEPDKGIYDAMNKGIRMASGDIVGILNSDDVYYDPTVLQSILSTFKENKTDSIYAGAMVVEWDDLSKIKRIKKGSPMPPKGFSTGWHPSHPTFYVKRECYDKYGVFDEDFGIAADMELMIRFLEKYKISSVYLPKILVKMRFGGASNSSIKVILNSNKDVLRAFEKNGLSKPKFYLLKKFTPKVMNMIGVKLGLINTDKQ